VRSLLSLLCLSLVSVAFGDPRAQVTLKVLNVDSLPVEDAKATVVFHKARLGELAPESTSVTGITDSNGCFFAEGEGLPYLFLRVEKEGYYRASKTVRFKKRSRIANRWKPWNSLVELTLKKRLNPESMYHFKRTQFYSIPVYDTHVGYDFEQADWVKPYGKGETPDVILHIKRRFVAWNDYDVVATVSFPNDGDGIQKFNSDRNETSSLKWPYLAPVKGYNSEIIFEKHYSKDGFLTNYDDEADKYIFRVRTVKDDKGDIKSACHGKLSRIRLGWGQELNWEYWFSPDKESRNLEHDPSQNLFDGK